MPTKVTLPTLPPFHSNIKANQNKEWLASLKDSHSFSEDAHWVIPGHLMQGKHPIRECFEDMAKRVHDLVHRGRCTTFVCLQAECPPQRTNTISWYSFLKPEKKKNDTRVFGGVRDWKSRPFLLQQYRPLVESAMKSMKKEQDKSEIKVPSFVHYGMQDLSPAEDLKELVEFVKHLATRILAGEVIYLHCWGGKGRSGLVAACLLGALYSEITAEEALQRIGSYCQMRNAGYHIHSPETSEQENQVRDFYALL